VNHLSHGTPPSDILQGAINSLVDRSVQLLEGVQLSPEYTLVGGMLRFDAMARVLADRLGSVNVPSPDVVQLVGAIGAAQLGQRRLRHAAVS
jgi:activator of 2-hydroxyglutaryl-CoA dehydratase